MSSKLKKRCRGEREGVADDKETVDSEDEEEEEGEGEEGDSWSDSDSEVDSDMEVNVQFEVRPIVEDNYPGIRRLLQQLLLKGSVDVSGLAKIIISQDGIGSVIQVESDLGETDDDQKREGDGEGEGVSTSRNEEEEEEEEEEEDEVCGVVSVINLTHHRTDSSVQSLTEYLLAECQRHSPTCHSQFSRLLQASSGRHVGLLVNERLLNIPPHVAPPLLTSLVTELTRASRKGLPYNFESYVILARSYLLPSPLASPRSKKRRRQEEDAEGSREGEGAALNSTSSNSVLHCQEYEELQEESLLTFSYPVSGEGCGGDSVFGGGWKFEDDTLQQTRTVMVVPAAHLQAAIARLSSALS